jgi:epoxyqueuosine reductase QueG
MDTLSKVAIDFVIDQGACAAGIATLETLKGGPPSADLTYVLSNAKSAITYAVPIDQKLIDPYFAKEDHIQLEKATYLAYTIASGISLELGTYLKMKGYDFAAGTANRHYRMDTENGISDMVPTISHRYLAVRSGVGHFGLSGNILTSQAGAAVALGSVVTNAELVPTDPLPEEENYCDNCGMCIAGCASGFMKPKGKISVSLGGIDFSYSGRSHYMRCGYVCAGYTGLHPSGKWSTWSPGRFPIPEEDDELIEMVPRVASLYGQWPRIEGGFYHVLMDAKLRTTCANCQFICFPDRETRKKRLEMLTESGVVIQKKDGSLEAVNPEEAQERLKTMSPEKRGLYEET